MMLVKNSVQTVVTIPPIGRFVGFLPMLGKHPDVLLSPSELVSEGFEGLHQ